MAIAFSLSSAGAFAQEREEHEGSPRARQEWFYHQRAYPLKHTPPGARARALGQKLAMQQREAAAAAQTNVAINNSTWTLIGPQPTVNGEGSFWSTTSGRVTAIAVDTTDATGNTLYIGGAEGGVWKTTNGGTNWTPLTDSQFSLAIGAIAVDPNNHLNVYVGTGEENFNGDAYYGGGLLMSANGGTSWTHIGASTFGGPLASEFGGSYIGAIAVQPGSPPAPPSCSWPASFLAAARASALGSGGPPMAAPLGPACCPPQPTRMPTAPRCSSSATPLPTPLSAGFLATATMVFTCQRTPARRGRRRMVPALLYSPLARTSAVSRWLPRLRAPPRCTPLSRVM